MRTPPPIAPRKNRNSSIELLRIIAMFMILESHFVIHNDYDFSQIPIGFERFFLVVFMADAGKIGVVVFFTISAWFLIDKEVALYSSLKRLWILEREVLFYSIFLGVVYYCTNLIETKVLAKSFLPLLTNTWWYVSAYALFLVFLPFVLSGLRLLGKEKHLPLAVISLILLGVLRYIPGFPAADDSYATFILLFIIISAYKWYFKSLDIAKSVICIIIGICFMILRFSIFDAIYMFSGLNKPDAFGQVYVFPVLMVGFGLFSFFNQISFHSKVTNRIAKSAFAVYLITDYPASEQLLWGRLFDLEHLCQDSFAIIKMLIILFCIYSICTVVDFVRQFIFAFSIDRNPGHLFDIFGKHIVSCKLYLRLRRFMFTSLCDSADMPK